MARRILVNYRAKPEVVATLLPSPFRPKLIKGWAIVGICLIRLEELRPKNMPAQLGIKTENAAHRIAVEWDKDGITHEGVFIPRRETNNPAIALTGGRIFPGEHHQAVFEIEDTPQVVDLHISTKDGKADVHLITRQADALMPKSVFENLSEASQFFCNGSMGFSPNHRTGQIEVMELRTYKWEIQPLTVVQAYSEWFADTTRFPKNSLVLDSAFIMRGIRHEWQAHGELTN